MELLINNFEHIIVNIIEQLPMKGITNFAQSSKRLYEIFKTNTTVQKIILRKTEEEILKCFEEYSIYLTDQLITCDETHHRLKNIYANTKSNDYVVVVQTNTLIYVHDLDFSKNIEIDIFYFHPTVNDYTDFRICYVCDYGECHFFMC